MDIPDYYDGNSSDEEKIKPAKGPGKGEFSANLTGWNDLLLKD